MANNDSKIIDMIRDNFKNLYSRLDKIESKIDSAVTETDCKKNRKNCIQDYSIRQTEVSIKKLVAIGGVVTGVITVSTTFIATLLKTFF